MTFSIDGMMCANCSRIFEEKAAKLQGVDEINVNYAMAKVNVTINRDCEEREVINQLKKLCREIEPKARLVEEKSEAKLSGIWQEHSKELLKIVLSLFLMTGGIFYKGNDVVRLGIFVIAYLLVARDVLFAAYSNIRKGEIFDENFLMVIATAGAFAIGEYPEGIAVMLFYSVGELFQDMAVKKSRASIKDLMDIRPDYANLKTLTSIERVSPEKVRINDIIVVKPGEKVPLDGVIFKGEAQFDTAKLTGESVPRTIRKGETVLSGFINKNSPVDIRVQKTFGDSTASKILDMVEHASAQKAHTERFITKFARYYTPAVVLFAVLLAVVPPLMTDLDFGSWIYRALVFLVVSCPCALVVSIPLGFFGGIGAASKHGILVKGGNYLEAMKRAEIVVMDKTGTLTEGSFTVHEIQPVSGMTAEELLRIAAYAEYYSNHPIALSIQKKYAQRIDENQISDYREIEGEGISVKVEGRTVLAGNDKLMQQHGITGYEKISKTVVHIAIDGVYQGFMSIYDKVKSDARQAVSKLKVSGIRKIVMLTGDSEEIAAEVARTIGIDEYHGNLLPEDKMNELEKIIGSKSLKGSVLFTGDGINDAPVLARSDVGIAMGGLGSDAAIEAADVVIMTDEPSKIAEAIEISKKTIQVVWQNIALTFVVKVVVLAMGAFGIATMWEAVFADVGVALIAILNAARIRNL